MAFKGGLRHHGQAPASQPESQMENTPSIF